jgi:predicted enzyme related to lactoylglutathione lyase
MANSEGGFVWYELATGDLKGAEKFYSKVVGWTVKDAGMPGMTYLLLHANEIPVGGMMTMPPDCADVPPHWIGYIGVDNVDQAAAKVERLGGKIHREPHDIPGVGRFAVMGDPQGVGFCLFRWADGMAPPSVPPMTRGHVGWHELYTPDLDAGFGFYAEMFGWTKADTLDMGPMGRYQLFAHNGVTIGGMMRKPDPLPVGRWGFYFVVDAIDAALGRAQDAGCKLLNGPMEVPGGAWIIQALDPQSAAFELVGAKR